MTTTPAPGTEIRESVREHYAAAARRAAAGAAEEARGLESASSGCCGPSGAAEAAPAETEVFGAALYDAGEHDAAAAQALEASLGCGVPTQVADIDAGETVLDLGSGAGGDALIAAGRVGPEGHVIGLDMTDEMLELARRHAAESGLDNVEFRKGYIESLPVDDASVDVVISNCVINLSADKAKVLGEAARVLRPGGRFAVSAVIADAAMPADVRSDLEQWAGCVAGALTRDEFAAALARAGLVDVEVRETHRVHDHAGSAIIRARKPD